MTRWKRLSALILLGQASLSSGTNSHMQATVLVQSRGVEANSTATGSGGSGMFLIDQDGSLLLNGTSMVGRCNYSGEIVIGHATSTGVQDRFYDVAIQMLESAIMTIDHINQYPRCGVHLTSGNYSLRLLTYSDDSDPIKVQAISRYMAASNTVHLWTAGYSSTLTQHVAPIAQESNNLLLAAGASQTSIYTNRSLVFGTFPPGDNQFHWAFYATRIRGAQTVAYLQEDGATLCEGVPSYAQRFNMRYVGNVAIPANTSSSSSKSQYYLKAAQDMAKVDPDVMVTCVLQPNACADWIAAMRKTNWQPKAQVFTTCIGSSVLEALSKTDLQYMMGVTLWDKALKPIPDAITGWTPAQFAKLFERAAFRNSSYHPPSQSAAISIMVQAMERADSYTDKGRIRDILARETFTTVFGEVAFDENGQGKVPSVLLQYDDRQHLHVLYPRERASPDSDFDFVYPLPTWEQRDCRLLSPCESEFSGICESNGSCACPEPLISMLSTGQNATCKDLIPVEDMGYIDTTLVAVGYSMVGIQVCLSLFFLAWTWKYRSKSSVVRLSQPIFLGVIAVGALIMSLAIVPMATETSYRWLPNTEDNPPNPHNETNDDVPNPDIHLVDAACMAWLWLVVLGFAMIYAGLFAKLWRVKMLMDSAVSMRRREITPRDVGYIMVVLLVLEGTILLTWQLVAPLHWERDVVLSDEDGYPLKSVGKCKSDHAVEFGMTLAIVNGGCLVYALVLAYLTRNVPTQLSEGTWIALSVASTFQILLLSIPTLVIAHEDTNASFFVRSTIVFLVSSTSTLLIFGPKFYRLHFAKAEPPSDQRRRSTIHISGLDFPVSSRISSRVSSRYSGASAMFSANGCSNHTSVEFNLSSSQLERELERTRKPGGSDSTGTTKAATTANGSLPEVRSEEGSTKGAVVEEQGNESFSLEPHEILAP